MCIKTVNLVPKERRKGVGFKYYTVHKNGNLTSNMLGTKCTLGVPSIAAATSQIPAASGEEYLPLIHVYKENEPRWEEAENVDGVWIEGYYEGATVEDDTVIVVQGFTPLKVLTTLLPKDYFFTGRTITPTSFWFLTQNGIPPIQSNSFTRDFLKKFIPTRRHFKALKKVMWDY